MSKKESDVAGPLTPARSAPKLAKKRSHGSAKRLPNARRAASGAATARIPRSADFATLRQRLRTLPPPSRGRAGRPSRDVIPPRDALALLVLQRRDDLSVGELADRCPELLGREASATEVREAVERLPPTAVRQAWLHLGWPPEEGLGHPTARDIYAAIRARPGTFLAPVSRELDLTPNAIRYHVFRMRDEGWLAPVEGSEGAGHHNRWIAVDDPPKGREAALAGLTRWARPVLEHVEARGPTRYADLKREVGISSFNLSKAVHQLEAAGLVRRRTVDRETVVSPLRGGASKGIGTGTGAARIARGMRTHWAHGVRRPRAAKPASDATRKRQRKHKGKHKGEREAKPARGGKPAGKGVGTGGRKGGRKGKRATTGQAARGRHSASRRSAA